MAGRVNALERVIAAAFRLSEISTSLSSVAGPESDDASGNADGQSVGAMLAGQRVIAPSS